ncbi:MULTISPECIES: hypothetical protein [Streptomyces]|uniref:Lipoprotein n=2 Tax=Streptomyces TaxID=1883 RepID=A0ABU4K2Q7_9ACTN|nr:hypothetical protein [Streptomyces roseolus]MDX2292036.1 hypothetical protein [Streptomyces roseolus]
MVRTRVKMAATLTVVVLALTGFQTSSGGKGGGSGKSKSKSSGGGGCSSDKKDNDDYAGSGSGGDGGSGSGYTSEPTATASPTGPLNVTVVDCVKPAQKKRKGRPARRADTSATVRIVSEASFGTTEIYKVTVEFKSAAGAVVDSRSTTLRVEDGGQKDFEVKMAKPGVVDKVRNCEVRVDDMSAY